MTEPENPDVDDETPDEPEPESGGAAGEASIDDPDDDPAVDDADALEPQPEDPDGDVTAGSVDDENGPMEPSGV